MPKVKVIENFIGQPDEHKEYAGQIPANLKSFEKKMSDAEKNSFSHLITRGTTIEVSDKRARELAAIGLVEYKGITKEETPTETIHASDKPAGKDGKVDDVQVKEKNSHSGPNGKK